MDAFEQVVSEILWMDELVREEWRQTVSSMRELLAQE